MINLTMPKYLLRLRKISCLLKDRSLAISEGSSRVLSKASATLLLMPPWKSLMEAMSIKGASLSIGAESQAWGSGKESTLFLGPLCLTFCCLAAHWASYSNVGWDFSASITSLPFDSLFHLGLEGSVLNGKVDLGGGWRSLDGAGGSLLWEGEEGLLWVALACVSFPGWDSIKSSKLVFYSLYIPMSSSKGVSEKSKFASAKFGSPRSPKGLLND